MQCALSCKPSCGRVVDHIFPISWPVAGLDETLQALKFSREAAYLRLRADCEPQVPLQVRVVTPVAHQDFLVAQLASNFRRLLAHARQDEIRGTGYVGNV